MTISLREYQRTAVEDIRNAYRRGRQSPLLVMPCGSGKTVLFSYITAGVAAKGGRVMILVHREHLIDQTSQTLTDFGVVHGCISPQHEHQPALRTQVASVFTLTRRLGKWIDYKPTLLVSDESHHSVCKTWKRILQAYPQAKVLGTTASPERLDQRGLIDVHDELIMGPSMKELIAEGYLAQYRMFAPTITPDLSGMKRLGGDYNQGQLEERMDRVAITGDSVKHYERYLNGAPAVAFGITVQHAAHVAEQFRQAGWKSTVIEAATKTEDRKQMLADLANGQINVLSSVGVIDEGTNVPVCQGCIMLRPTESIARYIQMTGRVLRPKPNNEKAVLLDHAGNSLLHGLPCDDRRWSLENGLVEAIRDRPAARIRTCGACFCIFAVAKCGSVCPNCGHDNHVEKDMPRHIDGELSEQHPEVISKMRELEKAARTAGELEKLEHVRMMRGYKRGWSEHVLRGRLRKKALKELNSSL